LFKRFKSDNKLTSLQNNQAVTSVMFNLKRHGSHLMPVGYNFQSILCSECSLN